MRLTSIRQRRMKTLEKKGDLTYPQEHGFLVNCGGTDGQSEVAYYRSTPAGDPDNVAIVTSPKKGFALWENTTTTATFIDVGSNHQTGFTVTLGSRPNDGELAGNASNTWDTRFVCYALAPTFLYKDCFGIYDCNHADRVEVTPATPPTTTPEITPPDTTPAETSASTRITTTLEITLPDTTQAETPTSTTTTTPNRSSTNINTLSIISSTTTHSNMSSIFLPTPTSPPHHSSGPPKGVAIGIAIGITLGTVLLAIIVVSLLRKYWNWHRKNNSDKSSDAKPKADLLDGADIYEAASTAMPVELVGCNVHVYELEAKPRTKKTNVRDRTRI
ncbi:hypothetical protein HD806DRAFT_549554 [Xylariaceae sp. AK1471]|nr:hypothetical protein HD806DRAFT_549554 [Xylariaceae sp. AK1471]